MQRHTTESYPGDLNNFFKQIHVTRTKRDRQKGTYPDPDKLRLPEDRTDRSQKSHTFTKTLPQSHIHNGPRIQRHRDKHK